MKWSPNIAKWSERSLSHHGLLSLGILLLLKVQRSPEEHNVRLWSMNCIVDPTSALLNTNCTPFILFNKIKQKLTSSIGYFKVMTFSKRGQKKEFNYTAWHLGNLKEKWTKPILPLFPKKNPKCHFLQKKTHFNLW